MYTVKSSATQPTMFLHCTCCRVAWGGRGRRDPVRAPTGHPPHTHTFCLTSVFQFLHYGRLGLQSHPFFTSAARLWSRTRGRKLQVLGAARAGSSGDPGERLFVRRGQVDHEEDAVCQVLLRAGAGELMLPPTAADGGQQLTVPLRVLQVLQGDHVGQSQLIAEAEASAATPQKEAEGTEEDEEEEDCCYGDVGSSGTDDGLARVLVL